MRDGFTLIETVIYIALFTLLIGTGFTTAFQLIQSGDSLSTKTTVNSELDFVLRKIDWALNGIETINTPASGFSSSLSVTKYDGTNSQIQLNGTKIEINNGGGWIALTTDNVLVTTLGFQFLSGNPGGIVATTTINGTPGTTTRYIRK